MRRGGGYGAGSTSRNTPARRPATPAAARPRYFLEDLNSGAAPVHIGDEGVLCIALHVDAPAVWLIRPRIALPQDGGGITLVIRRQDMTDAEVAALPED
jgi:hypothetical protein